MKNNVYNISKLAFHGEKLKALSKNEVTAPLYVRIKPINACDHECSYCSYIPDNNCPVSETINYKDKIPKEKILEILEDFKEVGVKAVTYSGGGEPLIYPHITDAMKKTIDYGIDLSIITNGQKLSGEKADILKNAKWVRVSSSECDARTFHETRKKPESWFYELRKNLENFAKIKSPECEFGINFVVHGGNFDKIYISAGYFKNLGAGHIKITPSWNPNFLEYHEPMKKISVEQIEKARINFQDEKFTIYDTYKNDFEKTGLEERPYSRCYIMRIIPVIGADCVIYFCHDKTYNNQGVLGNIKDRRFRELWFSEESAEIFKNFNPKNSCRHHCTYDSRNIFVHEILRDFDNLDKYKPETERHKNFP